MSEKISREMFERVTDAQKNGQIITRPSRTYWQDAWRRFKKDKLAMAGLIVMIFIALAAIFGPLLYNVDPNAQHLDLQYKAPGSQFLFGTDKFGRDMVARIMFGARISLTVAIVATVINLFVGIIYGGISGFFGGKVDSIMMRIVDILYAIPTTLYVILIMVFLNQRSVMGIVIALAISYWVGMARIVRAQVMSLKEQEYVLAAHTLGASKLTVLFKHLIPNAMGPIIVTMTLMIPQAIFTEAFLSFLGIGIAPPAASWGTLLNDARPAIYSYPYLLLIPAIAIVVTMFALNFIGDGLRDALDPRLKK